MEYLSVIIDKKKVEGQKGAIATPTLILKGKEEYKAEAVTFKVFDVQNKLVARDPADSTTVINESIYFEDIKKDVAIPDRKGGNACGRSFPSWEGVKSFDKAKQREQSKKATFYKHLFGEVTFPNQKPILVNLRLTPGIFMGTLDKALKELGRDKAQWPSFVLGLEADFMDDAQKYATINFTVKERGLSTEGNDDIIAEVTKVIQDHNDFILSEGNH